MDFYTADYCDAHPDLVQVLEPQYKNYGGKLKAEGAIVTVKLPGNNKTLIEVLKTPGEGRVVVVDVDAQFRAVVGENLMKFAQENNWSAIIVNGYVRDTHITTKIDVALLALGTCPAKVIPAADGSIGEDIRFGGVDFKDGEHCYIDLDGIITTKNRF